MLQPPKSCRTDCTREHPQVNTGVRGLSRTCLFYNLVLWKEGDGKELNLADYAFIPHFVWRNLQALYLASYKHNFGCEQTEDEHATVFYNVFLTFVLYRQPCNLYLFSAVFGKRYPVCNVSAEMKLLYSRKLGANTSIILMPPLLYIFVRFGTYFFSASIPFSYTWKYTLLCLFLQENKLSSNCLSF